jgi:PKD repeat protein
MTRSHRKGASSFAPLVVAFLMLLVASGPTLPQATEKAGNLANLPSFGDSLLAQARTSLSLGKGPAQGNSVECAPADSDGAQCAALSSVTRDPANGQPYWTNLTGPVAPPRSDESAMAYDAADHYVVLFGGQSAGAYPLNDTWIFSNGSWTNITATAGAAPSARWEMAMTYDSADGYVLAFGGSSIAPCSPGGSDVCNDTWSFLHGRWDRLSTSPPHGYYDNGIQTFSMTYDVADGYVLATDGTATWRYLAGVWSPFCGTNCSNFIPAPGGVGTVAYDSSDGYVVYVGAGLVGNQIPSEIKESYTWKFSGGAWTNITASAGAPPPEREFASFVSDSATGGLLLFGGLSSNASGDLVYLNDTCTFADGTWSHAVTSPSPPGVYGAGIADDAAQSVIVLLGGDMAPGSLGNLNETWVWGTTPPIGELSLSVVPSVPVPGINASFDVAFAGGVAPLTYFWSFGDGGTSSAPDPIHLFGSEGFFDVEVWVNDSAEHSKNASLIVHVYTPLSISTVGARPNPALLGESVNFTAIATGGTPPYTYSWAFGDGGVGGNLSSISHIYTTNGPFEAEVSVTDAADGAAHAFLNVSIQLEALAGSTATAGASPLTVTFVGQAEGGTPPYTFGWNFGDGTPVSTLQNPTHRFNASGEYTVGLTVVDAKGDRSTSALTVNVGNPAAASPFPSGWFGAFALAAGVAVVVAVAWGVDRARQRSHRAEGRQWVEELTTTPEHIDDPKPR